VAVAEVMMVLLALLMMVETDGVVDHDGGPAGGDEPAAHSFQTEKLEPGMQGSLSI